MDQLEEVQEAIEAKRQGKTPEPNKGDVDKEIQTLLADLDQLKSAKSQDFKEEIVSLIKQLIEWCMELQEHKEIEKVTDSLQDRFKVMDQTITDLVRFRQGIEDIRFTLLFNTARYDYAFDMLVKFGLIERWSKDIYNKIWDDKLISLLGFDCNAEELKKKLADMTKNEESKGPHDQRGAMPQ